ncbi:MAG TPA: CBS domain-containing protein [Devosia sp.]
MLISALSELTRAKLMVIDEQDTVRTAAEAFSDPALGLIVACSVGGRAHGVISKSDLVRHLARAGRIDTPIAEVMTRTVVCGSLADDLHGTWQLMVRRRLQNLPLVDGDRKPVGMLDIRDALEAILRAEERQEEQLVNYIAGNGYR